MSGSPIDEVERQHVFIEAWMAGNDVPKDGWADFERSLGEAFAIVGPGGREASRAKLLEGFKNARGVMPGVTIEIRYATVIHETADMAVARYEEWQLHPTAGNQRISTVVFAAADDTPLGWSWLALHETGFG